MEPQRILHFKGQRYLSPMLHLERPGGVFIMGININTHNLDSYKAVGQDWVLDVSQAEGGPKTCPIAE